MAGRLARGHFEGMAIASARLAPRPPGARAARAAVVIVACALAGCTVAASDGADASANDARPIDGGTDAGPGYAVFFDEGLDEATAARFASADPGDDAPPAILYPEDGTLVPPNLRGVDVHFTGRVFDTFEITLAQGGAPSVVIYARCRPVEDGCVLQPWREVWSAMAAQRHRGPFEIRIRGLRHERVSAPSAPVSLELAQEEIDGALYFWTTEPPSIQRYDFALARRSSELFLSGAAEGTCLGCHAISRDGTRIAVGVHDPEHGFRSRVYDVATRTRVFPADVDAPLAAYGASNDLLLGGSPVDGEGDRPLRIVDGSTGTTLEELGVIGTMPAWSSDGARIVFEGPSGAGRELQLLTRAPDGAWSSPIALPTPDTDAESAPSFSPRAEWIGYTAQQGSQSALVARQLSGGRVAHLRRAGAGADATWLRWNPHPYRQAGRWIFWLTFSSRRSYGVLPEDARQIWMAAFDPEADPEDPSRPAFRFPAQRLGVASFIAEWTLEARRQPCEHDGDCPAGELCADGFCIPEGPE